MPSRRTVAYFISPHGLGHAARAAAVMGACHELDPTIRFEIFTLVSDRFFDQSLRGPFQCHPLLTDIGLVQTDPLHEDLGATWERVKRFFPFRSSFVQGLAQELHELFCRLVLCDIAPMGIAAARAAGIPCVLVENFTWDWIYEGYDPRDREVKHRIAWLGALFDEADHRIQTEPFCAYHPSARLRTRPVSRRPRLSPVEVKERLGVGEGSKLVMITMGGAGNAPVPLQTLRNRPEIRFVISGGAPQKAGKDNVLFLPHHSDLFHPDLVHACDAVVGKAGYSTVSEVYHAGVPFAYIPRPAFRESQALAAFLEGHVPGFSIDERDFFPGTWAGRLDELLGTPRIPRDVRNGAEEIADFVLGLLSPRGFRREKGG